MNTVKFFLTFTICTYLTNIQNTVAAELAKSNKTEKSMLIASGYSREHDKAIPPEILKIIGDYLIICLKSSEIIENPRLYQNDIRDGTLSLIVSEEFKNEDHFRQFHAINLQDSCKSSHCEYRLAAAKLAGLGEQRLDNFVQMIDIVAVLITKYYKRIDTKLAHQLLYFWSAGDQINLNCVHKDYCLNVFGIELEEFSTWFLNELKANTKSPTSTNVKFFCTCMAVITKAKKYLEKKLAL